MESNQFFFDSSACHGNMIFLGNRNPVIQGARSVMNMEETSKRRPFFSSPEDLYDEEYYDEQLPEKKRRLTPEQVHLLEKSFEAENKLEPERKTQLAKKLGLQPRQVAVWFQNRRARWKTKQLERDYDLLKCTYDNLLADYQSMVKENDNMKSQVVFLSEKLQAKDEAREEPRAPAGQVGEPNQSESGSDLRLEAEVKVEERLSTATTTGTGSAGSAVVDEDAPQLLDSCDSYFPGVEFPITTIAPGRLHSEEDDCSDEGPSCFADVFVAANDPAHGHGEALGWWPWP